MPRAAERKEHPLSMQLPEADIAIIDRAATLRGRSRTDFVREAAVRDAIGLNAGELAIIHHDRIEIVPNAVLQTLTRAGIRLATP